jgi:hypothetical protein
MTSAKDADWDLISAYSDGELPDAEMRVLEARLRQEPDLQAMLDEIRSVSGALAGMRPELAVPAPAPVASSPRLATARRNWKPLAAWASLAAAVVLFFGIGLFLKTPVQTALDLHESFLAKAYEPDASGAPQTANLGHHLKAPNMELANLFLVEFRELPDQRAVAHYTGRNKCRLTLLSGPEKPEVNASVDTQVQQWQADGRNYALLASGMDPNRFKAIAAYLKKATGSAASSKGMLAMKEKTESAPPCLSA